MDLCCRIEEHLFARHSIVRRRYDLDRVTRPIHDVVLGVRAIESTSDFTIRGLLADPRVEDEVVVEIIVTAAHPMLHRRCAGNPVLIVDDLTTELALAASAMVRNGPPDTSRHLLNVLLDRAWGQFRKPFRRLGVASIAPDQLDQVLVSTGRHPEDVLDRVALEDLRDRLELLPADREVIVRSWNTAVELGTKDERDRLERYRLKHARSQLRRLLPPELVA
jgi:hypothetical protein